MSRHFFSPEAQSRYSAARLEVIGAIGDLAQKTGSEFVVVSGDVFESNQLSSATISRALEALRKISVPVFLLPGNHDPLSAGSVYTSSQFREECPGHVHVLDSPREVRPGVKLFAAPWRVKHPDSSLLTQALSSIQSVTQESWWESEIRIVVAHGAVDSLAFQGDTPGQMSQVELEEAPVQYVALGDRHSVTEVSPKVWYSGSPEVTNFDDVEKDSGSVLVVEIEGLEVTVKPHRVGRWIFTTRWRDVNGRADIDALDADLSAVTDKERTMVRLVLKGALSMEDRARLDTVLERHTRLFAGIKQWQRHMDLVTVPAAGEFSVFTGFMGEAVQELQAQESEDARAALALLWRVGHGANSPTGTS